MEFKASLDPDSGEIIAHVLTDQDVGDASQVEALLDQIDNDSIGQFMADGSATECRKISGQEQGPGL